MTEKDKLLQLNLLPFTFFFFHYLNIFFLSTVDFGLLFGFKPLDSYSWLSVQLHMNMAYEKYNRRKVFIMVPW